jgi:Ala-tRNA(Pro) deacylase
MNATKLRAFLQSCDVPCRIIAHAPAYTAPETAAAAHVPGRDFAKTVIVDIGGRTAMVVLPANRKIDLPDLRDMLGEPDVRLASEDEFSARFPDCEPGAMPPFGNLYGLPVYVAPGLAAEEEIAFNAGTHHEVIVMAFADYVRLVHPTILDFATVAG